MSFSVVIPAHNAESFIQRAVASALSQDRECEVIVVADRCSDATAKLARDAGARVIERDFGSAGKARNAGVAFSERRYIAFLDADDRFESGWLTACEQAFEHTSAQLVFSAPVIIYERDEVKNQNATTAFAHSCEKMSHALLFENTITTSACAVERAVIVELGGFREDLQRASCEDLDLWLRISEKHALSFVPGSFVSYWLRPGSAVRDASSLTGFRDAHLRVLNEAFQRQKTQVSYRRRCIANAYLQSATRFISQGHSAAAREIEMANQFGAPLNKTLPLMLLSKSPKLAKKVIALRRMIKKRR